MARKREEAFSVELACTRSLELTAFVPLWKEEEILLPFAKRLECDGLFDFGLIPLFSGPILGGSRSVKGVISGRSQPKSTLRTLDQRLIWGGRELIYGEYWLVW